MLFEKTVAVTVAVPEGPVVGNGRVTVVVVVVKAGRDVEEMGRGREPDEEGWGTEGTGRG